jgi:hypothetical protein
VDQADRRQVLTRPERTALFGPLIEELAKLHHAASLVVVRCIAAEGPWSDSWATSSAYAKGIHGGAQGPGRGVASGL